MTARSGLKCSQLLNELDPLGSLARTFLESSTWNSTVCFLTWKAKATPRGRLLFRLAPSMLDTDETGCGLWPTVRAADGDKGVRSMAGHAKERERRGNGVDLPTAIKMWPTPTSRDHKDGTAQSCQNVPENGLLGRVIHSREPHQSGQTNQNGSLNPQFVEWLMGYPIEHTALSASETASFLKSRKSSRKPSTRK